ncbi:MAG: ATP-binding protein [Halobacteriota archaeon]|jgi:signal transduction histidine kinase
MAAILVVEGEAVFAHDLTRLLRHMGHTVDIACTGDDALRAAEAGHPDLAIIDIGLQGQLNGIKTATGLKEKLAVPFIYVTAHGDAATMDRAKVTRPFGYILKPLEDAEVYSAVEIALYLNGTEQELRRRAEHLDELLEEKSTQLSETERLAAIGETATLVGHDLRNPLQVLMNLTFSVKKTFNAIPSPFTSDEYQQKALDFCAGVEKQILYMDKIVSNLQDYAQELHRVKRSILVHELISDALSRVVIPDNVSVCIDVDRDTERLNGDPLLLSRVFANLIRNAVQAMPRGGQVTISARKLARELAISVADEGTGIPEEDLKSIFRPLTTNKAQGMGFGLAVCDKTVKQHGGRIEVDSTVGEGSTFTVLLPLDTK